MAKTSNIFTRVDPEIKERQSKFLRQIVMQRGLPFEVKLPKDMPLVYDYLTKEQFDAEIEKGMDDIRKGRVYSAEDVEEEMKRDYGI